MTYLHSGWPTLHPGDLHHTALRIPSGTSLSDVLVDVTYYKNYLLPFSPNHLNVTTITARDSYTHETYVRTYSNYYKKLIHLTWIPKAAMMTNRVCKDEAYWPRNRTRPMSFVLTNSVRNRGCLRDPRYMNEV